MQQPKFVTVLLYGGEKAVRRVLAESPNTVTVCSEEEFQRASAEDREPLSLAFPRAAVVGEAESLLKKSLGRQDLETRRSKAGD